MTDRKPERVYGVLVRDGRAFLRGTVGSFGLPGGVFRPMAEDRKVELRAHLWDQLGVEATRVWAQGAFEYRAPAEEREYFSGFYTVWEWTGDVPAEAGAWANKDEIAGLPGLPASLRTLLLSVLDSVPMRTR